VAIDVQKYNNEFIQTTKTSGQPYNDAAKYEMKVNPVPNFGSAQQYWRVVGVHHLTGDENKGNHHVYADILDENGQRMNGSRLELLQGGILGPGQLRVAGPLAQKGQVQRAPGIP